MKRILSLTLVLLLASCTLPTPPPVDPPVPPPITAALVIVEESSLRTPAQAEVLSVLVDTVSVCILLDKDAVDETGKPRTPELVAQAAEVGLPACFLISVSGAVVDKRPLGAMTAVEVHAWIKEHLK